MRDNPEFQEILTQLKNAESQNWKIDHQSRTSLAFSLSHFMFNNLYRQADTARNDIESDNSDDDIGPTDSYGRPIDYELLAQL